LGTYGNIIIIRHDIDGKEFETNYAHLRNASTKVKVGDSVKQGQEIALMGNTGGSTGQHLHFEIHVGRWATGQPNAVNPLLYISDPTVLATQKKLNTLGAKLKLDGLDGPSTEKAIEAFQKKYNLSVDGQAGPKTQAALTKAIEALAKAKPVAKPAPKPAPKSSTKSITIVGVKQAAFIVSTPSAKGNPLATIDLGKTIEINGSVPGWWEVKFNGRLGYVNEKFGRLN
jgi:pyruvate/2-oxoglutarate dehydrogenase complex dihydrolipoamide acyltransferase (E2) component